MKTGSGFLKTYIVCFALLNCAVRVCESMTILVEKKTTTTKKRSIKRKAPAGVFTRFLLLRWVKDLVLGDECHRRPFDEFICEQSQQSHWLNLYSRERRFVVDFVFLHFCEWLSLWSGAREEGEVVQLSAPPQLSLNRYEGSHGPLPFTVLLRRLH